MSHIQGMIVFCAGFDKYKGGLDSVHDLTGTESIYTAWRGIEIIFHVSTLLPHEEHDPQKVHFLSRLPSKEPNIHFVIYTYSKINYNN